MLSNRVKKKGITKEFILIALYSMFVFMFDADETNVRLIYVAYGLLCFFLLFKLQGITLYRESIFFILYLAYGIVSLLWAENTDTALSRVKAVFLLTILLVLLTSYSVKYDKSIFILNAIIVGAVALSLYTFYLYGVSGVLDALFQDGVRLGWEINNVNAIANTLVVGIIAIIGVFVFHRKRLILFALIPVGICFLVAGSRTAMISLIIGILALFSIKVKTEKDAAKKLFRLFAIVFSVVIVWIILRNIPAMQTIFLRLENAFAIYNGEDNALRETSPQLRLDYIRLGWEQFLKSPIVGNGIGCAGYALYEKYGYVTYLHNNYIEILASGGIIGFILYYTPYVLILVSLCKRVFKYKENDPIVLISLCLLITKFIGHLGTVVYYSKVEFLFLALMISVVNRPIKSNKYATRLNENAEHISISEISNGVL